jgi:Tfp pilus assembly protein PilF
VLWLGALLIVLAILIVGGGVYWYEGRSAIPSDVQKAIAEYQAGQHEAAWGDFSRAARQHPQLVLPHLYLARLAREQGDFATAGNELKTALQLEPGNAVALRELGAFFLARGTQFANQGRPDLAEADYDAARRNFVKSLTIAPTDRDAQGWLGCTLARLGRTQEAASWIGRAGAGPWSVCVAPTAPAGGSLQAP